MADIENILKMCSWCGRIKIDNQWVGKEYTDYESIIENYSHAPNSITHGICEDDDKKMREEYKALTGEDL